MYLGSGCCEYLSKEKVSGYHITVNASVQDVRTVQSFIPCNEIRVHPLILNAEAVFFSFSFCFWTYAGVQSGSLRLSLFNWSSSIFSWRKELGAEEPLIRIGSVALFSVGDGVLNCCRSLRLATGVHTPGSV